MTSFNDQKLKQCYFCTTQRQIDYKDAKTLKMFMSSQAKIYPRRKSGLCALHQRRVAIAVKRARFLGLIPFTNR